MIRNPFSSSDLSGLTASSTNIHTMEKTENAHWVQIYNVTPFFFDVTNDRGERVMLVPPNFVITRKLYENTTTLTYTSRNDLPNESVSGETAGQYQFYVELTEQVPPLLNAKML